MVWFSLVICTYVVKLTCNKSHKWKWNRMWYILVSLFSSLSLISGIILFLKNNWTERIEKNLYLLFWLAIVGLSLGGFFSYFLGELLIINIVLSTILFVSLILLSLRIKYEGLNTFYKFLLIILHGSNLFLVINLFVLVFNNN